MSEPLSDRGLSLAGGHPCRTPERLARAGRLVAARKAWLDTEPPALNPARGRPFDRFYESILALAPRYHRAIVEGRSTAPCRKAAVRIMDLALRSNRLAPAEIA